MDILNKWIKVKESKFFGSYPFCKFFIETEELNGRFCGSKESDEAIFFEYGKCGKTFQLRTSEV